MKRYISRTPGRIGAVLALATFSLFAMAADGGGCSSSAPKMGAAICVTKAFLNGVGDYGGNVWACNADPVITPPGLFNAYAMLIPHYPCGFVFCAKDLDRATQITDNLLGKDEVTAANEGLRCVLVGSFPQDVINFQPPPAWEIPGGCVQPANDVGADAGPINGCSEIGGPCDNSFYTDDPTNICCEGLRCPANYAIDPVVGECCMDEYSTVMGYECQSDSDCCTSIHLQCESGSCCQGPGADCTLDDLCCSGLQCNMQTGVCN